MTADAAHLYVYGVMRAEDAAPLDFRPVDDPTAEIAALPCGRLQTIVSGIEVDEILSTRRNMLGHAKALEQLMTAGPVLPMRFGLISPGAAQIRATIAAKEDDLAALLGQLEGTAEYGVRIAWKREAAMQEIVEADPALSRAYRAIAGKPETKTHYERLEIGRRVEGALHAKRRDEGRVLEDAIRAFARDLVVVEADEDIAALKADVLLDAAGAAELTAYLERLEAESPDRFDIKLVGPGPAYAFARVRLDWVESADLADAG